MISPQRAMSVLALVISMPTVGCIAGSEPEQEPEPKDGPIGVAQERAQSQSNNGLDYGDLVNGIYSTDYSDLTSSALGSISSSLVGRIFGDAAKGKQYQYLVKCALDDSQSVTLTYGGSSKTFPGKLGFATGWKSNSCGTTCQQWVSACLLAMVDQYDVHKTIGVMSAAGTSDSSITSSTFSIHEGSYWGNVFQVSASQGRYSCYNDHTAWVERSCTSGTDSGCGNLFPEGATTCWTICSGVAATSSGYTYRFGCPGGGSSWANVVTTWRN